MGMSLGSALLSSKASVIWLAALAAVLVFHCVHHIRMRGQHRWYHAAHVLMLLGMLYMYASLAFGWAWAAQPIWMLVYSASSFALVVWILLRLLRRRPLSRLWIVALAQQGAMIYMWLPMSDWIPGISYAFAAYFALETLAWLTALRNAPAPSRAGAETARLRAMALESTSAVGKICLSAMAASMGYMFVGMQLMMTGSQQERIAARQEQPGPPAHGESALPPLAQQPEAAVKSPADERAPPPQPDAYTVAPGDTLSGIASKRYGDARLWRSIEKANRGLDPRRLPIGRTLKLPPATSSR
jgi:hypothetical protein